MKTLKELYSDLESLQQRKKSGEQGLNQLIKKMYKLINKTKRGWVNGLPEGFKEGQHVIYTKQYTDLEGEYYYKSFYAQIIYHPEEDKYCLVYQDETYKPHFKQLCPYMKDSLSIRYADKSAFCGAELNILHEYLHIYLYGGRSEKYKDLLGTLDSDGYRNLFTPSTFDEVRNALDEFMTVDKFKEVFTQRGGTQEQLDMAIKCGFHYELLMAMLGYGLDALEALVEFDLQ